MRKPASGEVSSASVELCETDVCFLHIQLIGTNVRLPNMHKSPPDVDFESSKSPANSEFTNLLCCAVCFPHNNIAGIHLYDECTRSNALNVCHTLESVE